MKLVLIRFSELRRRYLQWDPTTSLPTYLLQGNEPSVTALNLFNKKDYVVPEKAEEKKAETKPEEKKADEKKPEEQKADEKKPEEKKPEEKKSDEKPAEEKKP